jgi:cysteine desulfuration protein SufE
MAVVLGEALNGQTPEVISKVPGELVFDLFGREVSMGKGMGLTGILNMVQACARRHSGA